METVKPGRVGYLDSLRSLGDGLLAGVQERFELFTVELQEEKFRLIQTFIWISAVVFAGMMAVAFASLTLVYAFPEGERLAVLGGLTVLYITALGAMIVAYRRHHSRQPAPFIATLREIAEDRACIQAGN